MGIDLRNRAVIKDVRIWRKEHQYRQPMKFGQNVVTSARLLDVSVTVELEDGRRGEGRGSMPLGNVWAWPPRLTGVAPDDSLRAMDMLGTLIADRICSLSAEQGPQHPIDLMLDMKPALLALAQTACSAASVSGSMPELAAMVVASPFDNAVFDAYGKALGRNVFATLGAESMGHDLAYYARKTNFPLLDSDVLRGRYIGEFVLANPTGSMPRYHLVGALDPLTDGENPSPVRDGRPETLEQWIPADELTHLKIKLNGNNLNWDVARILAIHAVAARARPGFKWNYSLDFNECAPNEEYLIECLERVTLASTEAFNSIQYVEQPTARDLRALPRITMHRARALKPVVIDESLLGLDTLRDAIELGYSGIALKACKGMSHSLVAAAYGQLLRMFLCVQDLTCPGLSLVHSAALASRIPGVVAIEMNACQYLPDANSEWATWLPELFTVRNGHIDTSVLTHPGLGINPAIPY